MNIPQYAQDYRALIKDVLDNGTMIYNKRTNTNCLTKIGHVLHYKPDEFPLDTTRKSYWKQAIAEMICYMRGYTTLEQFHSLGVHTWDANAQAWHNLELNPNLDQVGIIYGASARMVDMHYLKVIDLIHKYPTDRGIIWNFWNPEYFNKGCLRPCMMLHQFNVLNDTLYLTTYQRSCDLLLGGNFNMVQAWFLLQITAKLTGLKAGNVMHTLSNVHIYENQIELAKEQVLREPYQAPIFIIKDNITLDDIMQNINKDNFTDYFKVKNYQSHPPIKYPFTV